MRLSQADVTRLYPFHETARLRFILRDGKRILQQYFERPVIPYEQMPEEGYTACEWRDVPLLEEV